MLGEQCGVSMASISPGVGKFRPLRAAPLFVLLVGCTGLGRRPGNSLIQHVMDLDTNLKSVQLA